MQIGNPNDAGYGVLRNGGEASSLIMSAALKQSIASGSINTPDVNVKVGLAYLYTRMAESNIVSIRDLSDPKQYVYEVVSGDILEGICKKVGTTNFELKRLNPSASNVIRPKQKLKYIKASMQRSIYAWRKFDADTVAIRYNGLGDRNYSEKLSYILNDVFPNLVRIKKP